MKHFNRAKRYGARLVQVGVGLAVAGVAAASPPPTAYDTIVSAVDWSDVTAGIGSIAALIAAVLVVKRGVKMLLGMIGR